MKTYFLIEDVTVLKNGKIIAAGSIRGGDFPNNVIGSATVGKAKIKIVSVALVNSPPAAADKRAVHVQILEGDVNELKGRTFEFGPKK